MQHVMICSRGVVANRRCLAQGTSLPVVTLHDKLVCPNDEFKAVLVVEVLRHVLRKHATWCVNDIIPHAQPARKRAREQEREREGEAGAEGKDCGYTKGNSEERQHTSKRVNQSKSSTT
jgi:hypothetical protein